MVAASAATAMINYYEYRCGPAPKKAEQRFAPISAPTLVIWASAITTSVLN